MSLLPCVFYYSILTLVSTTAQVFDVLKLVEAFRKQDDAFTFTREYPYSKGKLGQVHDFIVIGSGAGGATIANRLSEVPEYSILLLEVGQPESFITDIPLACIALPLTPYNEAYFTEPQDNACLGLIDHKCAWPRGRALGGSSVINFMIYTRGNRIDFERWSTYVNDSQWSYDVALEYYKKSEDAHLEMLDEGFHNTGGPLGVSNIPFKTKILDAFLQSGVETNRKIIDYNGINDFGFGKVQANLRNGRRCSAAKSFIKPVEKRKNLRILIGALVTRILIDPQTKTAYGVEYESFGKLYQAYARKEVILSAGPIASPQLLMISGVGPAEHLREFNIPVINDRPVGQFLQDHVVFVGLVFLIDKPYGVNLLRLMPAAEINKFLFQGSGLLTTIGGVEALGFIKTPVTNYTADYPDIELIFVGTSITVDGGTVIKQTFRITDKVYDTTFKPVGFRDTWSVYPMLLHPKSFGYMRLKSADIKQHPKLFANYFTDPENEDVRTMVEAIKEIIRLSKTSEFQKMGSKLNDIPLPGCEQHVFNTDPYWECAVRTLSSSIYHQVGTCKMGRRDDPNAIVDSRLKVIGIDRLRVIDSSVIPFTLSAHTNAPTFMIAEQGADFIKADWPV